jgi:hypothetical protein
VNVQEKATSSTGGLARGLKYHVLPFGFKTWRTSIPASSEESTGRVSEDALHSLCQWHSDFKKTFDNMYKSLDLVLNRIKNPGKSLDLKKSRLLAKKIGFISNKNGKKGRLPMIKEIATVVKNKKAKRAIKIKSFLGLGSYKRK